MDNRISRTIHTYTEAYFHPFKEEEASRKVNKLSAILKVASYFLVAPLIIVGIAHLCTLKGRASKKPPATRTATKIGGVFSEPYLSDVQQLNKGDLKLSDYIEEKKGIKEAADALGDDLVKLTNGDLFNLKNPSLKDMASIGIAFSALENVHLPKTITSKDFKIVRGSMWFLRVKTWNTEGCVNLTREDVG